MIVLQIEFFDRYKISGYTIGFCLVYLFWFSNKNMFRGGQSKIREIYSEFVESGLVLISDEQVINERRNNNWWKTLFFVRKTPRGVS